MSLMPKFFAFCFGFVLFFAFGTAAFADTIRLKDGSVIKGKVVDFKNQQFTVVLNGSNSRRSQLTLYIDDVDSIEFDSSSGTATSNATDASPARETPSVVIRNENAATNNNTTSSNASEARPTATTTANNNAVNTNSPSAGTINAANNTQSNSNTSNSNNAQRSNTGGLSQVINSQPTSSNNSRTNQNVRSNKFIPVNIKVLADNTANGWTNTGLVVKKGQRLRISATGRVALGNGKFATPAGLGSIADTERLMKTEPTGALIAVIGDDNNDFIFVGSNREFEATRDGTLFLGVNEGNLNDNSGAFDAVVEAEAIDVTAQRQ